VFHPLINKFRGVLGLKNKGTSFVLLTFQDFVDCGVVFRCLRETPGISNGEISAKTKLLPERVKNIRSYIEQELGFPNNPYEKPLAPPMSKEEARNILGGQRTECPVKLDWEYTSRISSMSQGVGIAFVNSFSCHIPGTSLGELVRFRIKKIEPDRCRADLIRIVQKNLSASVSQVQESSGSSVAKVEVEHSVPEDKRPKGPTCIECNFPASKEDLELHDGLCKKCWYARLQNESAKDERRSGTVGTDRAGTW
jgi:predicted RNA-binding protein with TRAM domain